MQHKRDTDLATGLIVFGALVLVCAALPIIGILCGVAFAATGIVKLARVK